MQAMVLFVTHHRYFGFSLYVTECMSNQSHAALPQMAPGAIPIQNQDFSAVLVLSDVSVTH